MTLFVRKIGPYPVGIWLAFLALVLLIVAWAGQAYSLIDWDSAVAIGLQNERFSGNSAENAWALESWGVAATDMLWPLPLTLIALIGLFRQRFIGLSAGFMALSIGVYFPIVFAFQRWSTFRGTAIFAVLVFTVPSLLGILGLLKCQHLIRPEVSDSVG